MEPWPFSNEQTENSLLCDVEDSVADVVRRCLAVSVDEAAAPAVLWRDQENEKTVRQEASIICKQLRSSHSAGKCAFSLGNR